MLRNILLIAALLLAASLAVATPSHCSEGCNCSEAIAVCDTLNLEPFGVHYLSLKIAHPKVPLILKGQPFHIGGLEDVNSIIIENATIVEIDKSAFTGIPLLSWFSIVNSNIPTISDPLAFANATNLRNLRISNTTLSRFESVKSHSLLELDLSGCKLKDVSKKSFVNLPNVSYINLANNNISQVDPLAFSTLLYLEELVLSDNHISSLNPDLFKNNAELVSLDLSSNPLKTFDINFVSELEKLVLKSVKLEHFTEKMASNLTYLSHLDLSHNKINFSTTAPFEKMADLEYIDLSNNELKHLDSQIFKSNYRLQKVILDNNNFTVMPRFVCTYDNFEIYFFSCKNCGLTSLPMNTFKHMPAVVILNLSHNRLNGINLTALQHLPSLIDLDLSHNDISVINPLAFVKSTGLETLNLAGNPIARLDAKLFHNSRAITSIDLSFCKLEQLWKQPVKGKIPSLSQLNLANNSLTAISPADLQVIASIRVLDLSNNPIKCDETLRDAITWLSEHEVSSPSISPTWKTHEPVTSLNAAVFMYSSKRASSWKDLAKQKCAGYDFEDEDEEEEEEEIDLLPATKVNVSNLLPDEYDEDLYDYSYSEEEPSKSANLDDFDDRGKELQFLEDEARIDVSELAYEPTSFRRPKTSYFWPVVVFVGTGLVVLAISVNTMLLMMRIRRAYPNLDLPHIKIPEWSSSGKMKKHSGSVYQPLSEDRSGPATPIISRKEQVPTHCSTPKPTV